MTLYIKPVRHKPSIGFAGSRIVNKNWIGLSWVVRKLGFMTEAQVQFQLLWMGILYAASIGFLMNGAYGAAAMIVFLPLMLIGLWICWGILQFIWHMVKS